MWIEHKAKDGEKFQDLLKKYKTKDPNSVLKNPKNKPVLAVLKKNGPLKKGMVIWFPDPKAKVYVIKDTKGKPVVLTEKQYREHMKNVHKTMDAVLARQQRKLDDAVYRHEAQAKINADQWFVSSIVGAFSSVKEPKALRGKATAVFNGFAGAVKGRKYAQFKKLAVASEEILTRYQNEVSKWVGGLISTAEGSVTVLKGVRDSAIFVESIAIVSVAAPASLAAGVLIGAGTNAGVNLVADGADALGRGIAGAKQRSLGELGQRLLVNSVTGAAGAAIAGVLVKTVAGPLGKALLNNKFLSDKVASLASKTVANKVFEAEAKNAATKMAQNLAKKGISIPADSLLQFLKLGPARNEILVSAMGKLFTRIGTKGFMKHIGAGSAVNEFIETWIKQNPKKLQGKDKNKIAELAIKDLLKSEKADQVYEAVLKENIPGLQKELAADMEAYVEKAVKDGKLKAD